MSAQFYLAAQRHFADAKLLQGNARNANAGQLFGFCAECGIKALFVAHGYPIDTEGSPDPSPRKGPHNLRKHINEIQGMLAHIDAYLEGRSSAKYLARVPGLAKFSDWSVDHRYFDEASIPESLHVWAQSAAEVMAMLQDAYLEGVTL